MVRSHARLAASRTCAVEFSAPCTRKRPLALANAFCRPGGCAGSRTSDASPGSACTRRCPSCDAVSTRSPPASLRMLQTLASGRSTEPNTG